MPALVERQNLIRRPEPDAVHLKGLVGKRFDASRRNRLRHQEEDHLLWPFQEHCPVGYNVPDRPRPEIVGDWQGEYLGTWLDAAVLSAWNAGDDQLRQKINDMVADWLATQEQDGYLGTYDEDDRWKSWDIWVQAHDLIGLISHYRYSGDEGSLEAAVRVADRVLQDFGPGKRFVYPTGPHGGMASSAILEPMIWLYWETGYERFLDWSRWLVDVDWEQPGGPQIVSSLLAGNGVAQTADGKGIEMLICFAGMVDLHRATGVEKYLKPVLLAWQDIVEHHLFITGSASTGERFMKDYTLRNDGIYMIGETCVSMGWMYLNLKLGRLLGEARFFDMVEQTLYNHLLSAQSPDGKGWQYYTGLRDHKRYRWHTDPECCPTRGVRALAQMPQHAFGLDRGGFVVNFYDAAEAELQLLSGHRVKVSLAGDYPFDGKIALVFTSLEPATFAMSLRLPGWCYAYSLTINDEKQEIEADEKGYLVIHRTWRPGDEIALGLEMAVRVVIDKIGNNGTAALVRGPLVYAADSAYLPEGWIIEDVVLLVEGANGANHVRVIKDGENGSVQLTAPLAAIKPAEGLGWWREKERYHTLEAGARIEEVAELQLVPFFEAGNKDEDIYRDGIWQHTERVWRNTYQVWLPYAFRK